MKMICQGRTVFIIAHRLTAVRNSSQIFVLEKGRVIENGSPAHLMAKKGAYFNLVQAQEMTPVSPTDPNRQQAPLEHPRLRNQIIRPNANIDKKTDKPQGGSDEE